MTEKLELNELIKLQEKSSFCHHIAVYMEGDLSFFSPFLKCNVLQLPLVSLCSPFYRAVQR